MGDLKPQTLVDVGTNNKLMPPTSQSDLDIFIPGELLYKKDGAAWSTF